MVLTLAELKKYSIGQEPEKDQTNVKIASLIFFGLIFSSLFGFSLNLFLTQQDYFYFFTALLAFFVFLSVFLLQTLFIEEFWKAFVAVLIEWLGILLAFNFDKIKIMALPDWRFLIGSGLAFLVLLLSVKKSRDIMKDIVKIRFWKISRAVLPTAIAALFLFASAAYVYGTDKKGFIIPYSDFKYLISSSDFLTKKIYPEFNSSWTIAELTSYLAEKQMEKMPQFEFLSKAVKKTAVNAAVKDFEKKISDFAGIAISAKLQITEAAYEILKSKLSILPPSSQNLISFSVFLLVFLLLEGVAVFVRLLVVLLAFILYEVLLAADFAKISYEGISKEYISLK